jgi:translocation and assembly module TamB
MVRRSLGAVLWSLVGLLSCFLGALAALLGTGAGRSLLAHSLAGTLERVVAGRVEVGDVGGTLFSSIVVQDVRLFDHDSTLVAWLPLAELAYNPFDFAAGRVVMQEVRLERPQFNLVQHANGRLNLEELLRLGEPRDSSRPHGPPPLVLLRNVDITDGSLVLRLQDVASPADSALEIDEYGQDGRRRVRRFDNLNLKLTALRLQAPRERGIRADITSLAAQITDPNVTLRDLAGRMTVVGDSMDLDLTRVALPGSHLAITGRLTWPRGPILYDLDIVADSADLGDFAWIDPRLPADAELSGAVAVRSSPPRGRVLTVKLDPVRVRHHGGVLTGKVTAVSLADSGLVRLRDGDLTADNIDLELARPFLDTLPFAGRLTGHTIVSGPMDSLSLDADWVYRDSLVPGWPETRIVGNGIVDLGDPEGIAFHPFTLTSGSFDLGTMGRLVPALSLHGVIDGVGTIEGPYTNATYTGWLRHHSAGAPVSQLRGRLRLDARRDTLGVSADLVADTLSFAGLRPSYPGLPNDVTLSGAIRLEGTTANLVTHADLQDLITGARLRVDGRLVLLAPPLGARDLTLVADNLDLRSWLSRWPERQRVPPSRLSFTVTGDFVSDSGTTPLGALRLHLAPSSLAGAPIDSAAVVARWVDGRMYVDSLLVGLEGLRATGAGALGWRTPATGRLAIDVVADSLNALDSLAAWLAPAPAPRREGDSTHALAGTARLRATLSGALDSIAVEGRAEVRALRWREWAVPAAEAAGRWRAAEGRGAFDLRASADSIAVGDLGFGGAVAHLEGRPDSLSWFARSRVGDWLALLAGGRLTRDSAVTTAHIDSAAVLLPKEVWLLARPATVRLTDAAVGLPDSGVDLRSASGAGQLQLAGALPLAGAGQATLSIRQFPLAALLALAINDTTGARGRLDADVTLGGTRRDPEIASRFTITGGTLREDTLLVGRGTVAYGNRRLDADVRGYRGARRIVDATAHLPLDLGLVTVPRRQLPDTLAVRVVVDSVDLSQLGLLDALTPGIHGRFSADIGVRGTWDEPALTGRAGVWGAGVPIPALNASYENVNGRFSFAGDTIRVDSLSLRSGSGSLAVTGSVRLEQLTRPVLALELKANEFRALEIKNFMSVTASGDLNMRGPLVGATLTGRGTATSGVLYFADLLTKRVVNLDDPGLATLIEPDELREQEVELGLHYRILDSLHIRNLNLAMGSDVWLRSNEANIQLTGTVNVSKDGRNYVLSGTLQAPRGTYRLVVGPVTREFVVTQGTVRYFGTPDLNAELDIQATHVVHPLPASPSSARAAEDITVIAHIGGTLLVPKITLSVQDRNLSQTEIISYLIFGRSSFELAGQGQGNVLAQSALQNVANAVTGELERKLVSDLGVPLDYLEIDFRAGDPGPGRTASALLAAGWQIGERTFLTVNAGVCPGGGRQNQLTRLLGATLQFRISPEWRTEASVEPVRSCFDLGQTDLPRQFGLDLFWERRY